MADPLLQVTDAVKSFGALRATDGVTLSVLPGEVHALIGPNGAGKSTLIGGLAGTLRFDSGDIRLLGNDVGRFSADRRARLGLGRTFQISSLMSEFSVLRNVMLAVQGTGGHSFRAWRQVRTDDSLRVPAMTALERVGMAHRADDPAAILSHGERRQLELAIALALEPRIMLLDEPMAGLGPEDGKGMLTLLDSLRGDLGILLVEHDMDAVFALADRISVLVYGRIIASGTPAEIRASEQVRHAYLGDEVAAC